jgi:hypothetical protein
MKEVRAFILAIVFFPSFVAALCCIWFFVFIEIGRYMGKSIASALGCVDDK